MAALYNEMVDIIMDVNLYLYYDNTISDQYVKHVVLFIMNFDTLPHREKMNIRHNSLNFAYKQPYIMS